MQITRIQRETDEALRICSMLSDDQQRECLDRAKRDINAKVESGEIKLGHAESASRLCYTVGLAYKYACELLNIEPKTGETI